MATAGGTATVEVLTAEVRQLVVGSRQVTMSVYGQLDLVPYHQIEPFGRVAPKDASRICVVGRSKLTGALVRARAPEAAELLREARFRSGTFNVLRDALDSVLEAGTAVTQADVMDLALSLAELARAGLLKERQPENIMESLGQGLGPGWPVELERALSRARSQIADGGPVMWSGAGAVARKARLITKGYRLSMQNASDKAEVAHKTWSALPLIVLAGLR